MSHVLDDNPALPKSIFVFLYWVYFVPSINFLILRHFQGFLQNVFNISFRIWWFLQRSFKNLYIFNFSINCEGLFKKNFIYTLMQLIDGDSGIKEYLLIFVHRELSRIPVNQRLGLEGFKSLVCILFFFEYYDGFSV